jgi:hypothetical protein
MLEPMRHPFCELKATCRIARIAWASFVKRRDKNQIRLGAAYPVEATWADGSLAKTALSPY